jgi:hypothetical protein
MPAIQPALLKRQAALVADHFDDPVAFARSLGHLLDMYADRVQRPGQSGTPRPLLPAYHVRPPVIRQVLFELGLRAETAPVQALALCDQLWVQPYLECRQIAIDLLGRISTNPVDPILDRVENWRRTAPERSLVEALLHQGLARLRRDQPQIVINLAETWLSDTDTPTQRAGLQVLLPLLKDSTYTNLPVFYRVLRPWVGTASIELRPDLLNLIETLGCRSPQETALFLRQFLNLPERKNAAWVIRQVLHVFPDDLRTNLRNAMRADRS